MRLKQTTTAQVESNHNNFKFISFRWSSLIKKIKKKKKKLPSLLDHFYSRRGKHIIYYFSCACKFDSVCVRKDRNEF